MRGKRVVYWATVMLAVLRAVAGTAFAQVTAQIAVGVETGSSHHAGDTADDSAIWVHPSDRSLSLIIGNDKNSAGGLMVWDLQGNELQYIGNTLHANLDLRYNFPLAGSFGDGTPHSAVDLIAVSLELRRAVGFYKVNPARRQLELIGTAATVNSLAPHGGCMYHSYTSGKYYFFANADAGGAAHQYELLDAGNGQVGMQLARTLGIGGDSEGCVADDVAGFVYFSDEGNSSLWKFGAEPSAGGARVQVDRPVRSGGHITEDLEGLAIYNAGPDRGYLIASDQQSSSFLVYRREGNNEYLGRFSLTSNGSVDDVTETDGIEVTNCSMGAAFPAGLFVAHDHVNTGSTASNHKLVSWESIAAAMGLAVDTGWDPRSGSGGGGPPAVRQGGVVSAATYGWADAAGGGLARGSIIAIFGDNLGPAAGVAASSYPLPRTLMGTSVRVSQGGTSVDAILLYASAGQVNAILPSNSPLGDVQLTVTRSNQSSSPAPLYIVDTHFGLFAGGTGGIIENVGPGGGRTFNSAQSPARPGQLAILWGTGLGPGSSADDTPPAEAGLPVAVEVLIGGRSVPKLYSGRAPGDPGVDNIRVQLPNDVALGCQVPVVVRAAGVASNQVTMAIAEAGTGCT